MAIGVMYMGEVLGKTKEMNVYGNSIVFGAGAEDLVIENPELATALKKAFNQSAYKKDTSKKAILMPSFASRT